MSNRGLAISMALSYYFECFIGWVLLDVTEAIGEEDFSYWIATAHPLSRLPVFFMGVSAGVLCVRLQNGDLDALNCKNLDYLGYLHT